MNATDIYDIYIKKSYERCQTVCIGAVYEHYKTKNHYMVFDVCTHTENGEHLVIYGNINNPGYDGKPAQMWARPKDMFESSVEVNGEKIPRFKLLYPAVMPE